MAATSWTLPIKTVSVQKSRIWFQSSSFVFICLISSSSKTKNLSEQLVDVAGVSVFNILRPVNQENDPTGTGSAGFWAERSGNRCDPTPGGRTLWEKTMADGRQSPVPEPGKSFCTLTTFYTRKTNKYKNVPVLTCLTIGPAMHIRYNIHNPGNQEALN